MTIKCLSCGKEKKTYPCRVKNGFGKYCSLKCSNKGKRPTDWGTKEGRQRTIASHTGDRNKHWKGDEVGNASLHRWVNKHIGRSKICEDCGSLKNVELTNDTGIYNRDFSNWKYRCRSCHMISDGRKEDSRKRMFQLNTARRISTE